MGRIPRGQPGNPKPRQKGSRDQLSESFLAAFCADFEAHGAEVIRQFRTDDPSAYLKAAVAILPKQTEKLPNPLGDLTDDELANLLAIVRTDEEDRGDASGGDGATG